MPAPVSSTSLTVDARSSAVASGYGTLAIGAQMSIAITLAPSDGQPNRVRAALTPCRAGDQRDFSFQWPIGHRRS